MRQRFVQGVGGTLRFTPPEVEKQGVPTSATISITRANGNALPTPVAAEAAVVDAQGGLSYALSGAQCPDPITNGGGLLSPTGLKGTSWHLYRAVWRYVIGGVTYETDQLYEVRRRVLKPTLTYAEVERDLPSSVYDLCQGGPQDVIDTMGDAWDDVLDDLAERGYEPDRVMDADRLRRPHREKTLTRLARTWGPQWRQFAIDRADAYQRALSAALEAGDWYESILADAREQAGEKRIPTTICTR